VRFGFIHAEKENHSVRRMCRALKVSPSGYYAWAARPVSKRQQRDQVLLTHIRAAHHASRGTYGSPRVHAELQDQGFETGRKRIARLMRQHGISARGRRRFRCTTDSNHRQPVAPNVLARDFEPEGPDQVWATDITYVWTWQGWLYLAVILDLFSRRVVGLAAAEHMRTGLVLAALSQALGRRQPNRGLLHHSDRGSQYASDGYQAELDRRGIVCSMSRRGDCYDNAVVESFFGTLKTELLGRRPWQTRKAAKRAITEYIEAFYNPHRRHSATGYQSPIEYERSYRQQQATQAA
jgi:transposase InsO family protein